MSTTHGEKYKKTFLKLLSIRGVPPRYYLFYGQDIGVDTQRNALSHVTDLSTIADVARRVPLDLTLNEVSEIVERIRPRGSGTRLVAVVNTVYIVRRLRMK